MPKSNSSAGLHSLRRPLEIKHHDAYNKNSLVNQALITIIEIHPLESVGF